MEGKIEKVLEELNRNIDNVRREFTYTDDIDRNIELQISVATLAIKQIFLEELSPIIDNIQSEIVSRPNHPNIGKKGCLKRLVELKTKSEMK